MPARLVHDRFTGELRLIAPHRAYRLPSEGDVCPFCPGAEAETPGELARIDGPGGEWLARAVPNRYPLSAHHEVLIPTARHVTSLRHLTDDEWLVLARLWEQRLTAAWEAAPAGSHVLLFVNDGVRAGASRSHTHAQLLVAGTTPPVAHAIDATSDPETCMCCMLLRSQHDLRVHSAGGIAVFAHDTPRMAGTLLVLPESHDAPREASPSIARGLAAVVRSLEPVDFNLLVMWSPRRNSHWYIEVVPRMGGIAGAELGLGVSIATQDPHDTAEQARARLAALTGR